MENVGEMMRHLAKYMIGLIFIFMMDAGAAEDVVVAPIIPHVSVGYVTEVNESIVKRYTGSITTRSNVDLLVRVPGELLNIGFEEGDTVRKGQILYELESIIYEADVKLADAGVKEAEARLAYAKVRRNRSADLHGKNAISKEQYDRDDSEYKAALASLLAAQAHLITAKDRLEKTKIRAPISGKIGQTNYTIGNYLTSESGIIATINQLDPLRITFAIANKDFLSMFGSEDALLKNAAVRIQLADGSVYNQDGRIEFLDNKASHKTDAIRIYSEFDNPDGQLIPGSTVTVLLTTKSGAVRSAILPSALMYDTNSAYVYVVDNDNRVERRTVIPGETTGNIQFISSGVKPGERVITDGTHKTMAGAIINPVVSVNDLLSSERLAR